MATASVYLLDMPGKSAITISQDELRSLLGQIEAQLHRSQVYRRIVNRLQNLLGDTDEQAKVLCKALGREAIGLAFQQFAQAYPEQDTNDTSTEIESENCQNLSEFQTQAIIGAPQPSTNTVNNTTDFSNNPVHKLSQYLTSNRKPSNAELVKQHTQQQYLEIMRQIGLQLKQARESHSKSLAQLHIYTHIPIDQMEAVENANLELLPDDLCVRNYIRVMGNALGMNGKILAASLPEPNNIKQILPSWCQPQKKLLDSRVEFRPIHLYLGYTALVAGAVGGLSHLSQPITNSSLLNSEVIDTPIPSVSKSPQSQTGFNNKPGIKTSPAGISVGNDIAPPEIL